MIHISQDRQRCDRVHDGLYQRSGLGYLSLTVDLGDTEY